MQRDYVGAGAASAAAVQHSAWTDRNAGAEPGVGRARQPMNHVDHTSAHGRVQILQQRALLRDEVAVDPRTQGLARGGSR